MPRRISHEAIDKYARACGLSVISDVHGVSVGTYAVGRDKSRVFIELHRARTPAEVKGYLVAYRDTMLSTAMAAAYLFPDTRDNTASQIERIQRLARRVCVSRALPV